MITLSSTGGTLRLSRLGKILSAVHIGESCVEGLSLEMNLNSFESHLGFHLAPIKKERVSKLFKVKNFQISGVPVKSLRIRFDEDDVLKQFAY